MTTTQNALQSRAGRRTAAAITMATTAILCLPGGFAGAQEPYRTPREEIVEILRAPPLPAVSLDPTRRRMLLIDRRGMPSIADLAQPMLQLAGRRINPATNGPHGSSGLIGLRLRSLEDGREMKLDLPEDGRLGMPEWSPNGSLYAFTVTFDDGVELWVGDTIFGAVRAVTGRNVNAVAGDVSWMPGGRQLIVRLVPEARGPAPERPEVPTGPVTQEASGRVSPVRTYQDLLSNPHDEALFDHYFTSQLVILDVSSGKRNELGEPAIVIQADPSPTGRYLLTTRIIRPYSYQVPLWSFPSVTEVRDLETGEVREIARQPLNDQVPIDGVPKGRRGVQWQDRVETDRLLWVEALDEGDPKKEVPHRDKVLALDAPFESEPVEIERTEHRFAGVTWIEGSDVALLSDYDRDRRWVRTWVIDTQTDAEPRLLWDRSVRDRYGDPGSPVMTRNRAGRWVAMERDGRLFLSGSGASPEGDRPFLDALDLATFETERLWQSEGETYETVVDVLDADERRIMTRAETPAEPPNYFVRDLAAASREPITHFEHPAPQLRDVHKELVTYERPDGVPLSATLYLPPNYDAARDGPLPLVVWAYPLEYNDPYTAGQVRGSPYRFTSIGGSSHLFLLLEGYAIMDAATMPVVGEDPETVNDAFIEQIVASAQAAIDYAASRGVADPNRVGVGGHSYGAFMTANLLAHCDLFRAGIARSGAYNRTLTPFGFQSERRTFWEAPESYFNLSPFMHAHKINEPILLIHGEVDNNSGTFPIQSERLFHAVKGHGGTVRLVMLPHESHGYRAEESIMHVLAEMIDWFARYVKLSGG